MENPTTVRKIQIIFYCVKKTLWWTIFRNILLKFQWVPIFVKSRKVRLQFNQPSWLMEFIQNCTFSTHQNRKYDLHVYKMKQFYWLLCVAKNCDWSRKIVPLSSLTRVSLLVEWKLTAKAELNSKIYKSRRKCWKNQVSFCHRCSPVRWKVWTLPWKLQELKKYPRKSCGYGQPRGHFKKCFFDVHSWHQSASQQLFWHWKKLNFWNKLISETFCLLGLLNSR